MTANSGAVTTVENSNDSLTTHFYNNEKQSTVLPQFSATDILDPVTQLKFDCWEQLLRLYFKLKK